MKFILMFLAFTSYEVFSHENKPDKQQDTKRPCQKENKCINEIVEFSNKMDNSILAANKEAKKILEHDIYPLLLASNKGQIVQFKLSKDSKTHKFDIFDGLKEIWDWSKSVAHLLIWSTFVSEAKHRDKDYDWVSKFKEQQKNVKQSYLHLPKIEKFLSTIDQNLVGKKNSVNSPVELVKSPQTYIEKAESILLEYEKFIKQRLMENSFEEKDLKLVLKKTRDSAAWLFYGINHIIVTRSFRNIQQWKKEFGCFDILKIIISTGMPTAPKGIGSTRGNCLQYNVIANIVKPLVTTDLYQTKIFIVSTSNLTFENAYSSIVENLVASKIGEIGFKDSNLLFAKLMNEDLQNPSATLTQKFTEFTLKNLMLPAEDVKQQ